MNVQMISIQIKFENNGLDRQIGGIFCFSINNFNPVAFYFITGILLVFPFSPIPAGQNPC